MTLVLNGTPYSLQQLADVSACTHLRPYEQRVAQFIRQWLAGQERFVVDTSGSTGTPKPIIITRAQMVASAQLTGRALDLQPGDHALVCVSVEYIAGMMMLLGFYQFTRPLAAVTH